MIARSMKNRLVLSLSLSLVPAAIPTMAQLPTPNTAGVSAGHDLFSFHDIDAANKFWTALGGEPAELGPLKMTKFPGVLFLMRKGDPKGGTEGSTMPGGTAKQAFLMGPDDSQRRPGTRYGLVRSWLNMARRQWAKSPARTSYSRRLSGQLREPKGGPSIASDLK